MLKSFVFGFVAASVLAGSAMAAERGNRKHDPNRMICRTESEIGSKLRRTRVCHTQAEWDELRRQTRAVVEVIERGDINGCNCGS